MRTALGKASTLTPVQRIENRHDVVARKGENAADSGLLQRRHQNIRPALFHDRLLLAW